jgi:hypothetical protein
MACKGGDESRVRYSGSGGYETYWWWGGGVRCSPVKVERHFPGTYRLRLQGRRISEANG